ncbi:MAG TPA: flavodoxin family protein [Bacillota bacterium]|jgi:multimeric flavodoxin WrbA
MGTVVGLVASQRRLGNTEVMVKEALMGAAEAGAQTKLINLGRMRVLPCKGCMACVFKGEPCRLEDDVAGLYEEVIASDGFIVGAPTYFLGPTGVLKTALDRALGFQGRILAAGTKPAVIIATAGLPEWDPLTIPLLGQFALILGGRLVGSMTAYAPGPAQSLLDPANAQMAHHLGRAVATGEALPTPPNACPICHGTAFVPVGPGEVECPLCRVRGRLEPSEDGGRPRIVFPPEALGDHRWTSERMARHAVEWIGATRDLFKRDLRRVVEARKRYEDWE